MRYLVTSTGGWADVPIIRECHTVTIPGTNVITNNVITTDKISRAINPARARKGKGRIQKYLQESFVYVISC